MSTNALEKYLPLLAALDATTCTAIDEKGMRCGDRRQSGAPLCYEHLHARERAAAAQRDVAEEREATRAATRERLSRQIARLRMYIASAPDDVTATLDRIAELEAQLASPGSVLDKLALPAYMRKEQAQ
jgi:hypothetical protein